MPLPLFALGALLTGGGIAKGLWDESEEKKKQRAMLDALAGSDQRLVNAMSHLGTSVNPITGTPTPGVMNDPRNQVDLAKAQRDYALAYSAMKPGSGVEVMQSFMPTTAKRDIREVDGRLVEVNPDGSVKELLGKAAAEAKAPDFVPIYAQDGRVVATIDKNDKSQLARYAPYLENGTYTIVKPEREAAPRPPNDMRLIPGTDPTLGQFEPIPLSALDSSRKRDERTAKAARAADLATVRGTNQSADAAIKNIDDILADKNLDSVVGTLDTKLPTLLPGSAAVESKIENLRNRLVIDVLGALKAGTANGSSGFGALSNQEADILRNSVAALSQTTTEREFRNQLGIVRDYLGRTKNNLRTKFRDQYDEDALTDDAPSDAAASNQRQSGPFDKWQAGQERMILGAKVTRR